MIWYPTVLGTSPSPLTLLPWTVLLFPKLGKNSTHAVYHDTFCTISCFNFHLFTVNYKLSLFGQDLRGIVASPSLFSIRLKSSTLTRWQLKLLCLTALSFFVELLSSQTPLSLLPRHYLRHHHHHPQHQYLQHLLLLSPPPAALLLPHHQLVQLLPRLVPLLSLPLLRQRLLHPEHETYYDGNPEAWASNCFLFSSNTCPWWFWIPERTLTQFYKLGAPGYQEKLGCCWMNLKREPCSRWKGALEYPTRTRRHGTASLSWKGSSQLDSRKTIYCLATRVDYIEPCTFWYFLLLTWCRLWSSRWSSRQRRSRTLSSCSSLSSQGYPQGCCGFDAQSHILFCKGLSVKWITGDCLSILTHLSYLAMILR